jgi:spore maturation protein CgeB
VISDAWEGIDLFLEPGEEILVAKDGEAVADLLKGLTVRGAREIGCKARLRMLAEHTYAHRAIQVTRFLDPMVRHREAVA